MSLSGSHTKLLSKRGLSSHMLWTGMLIISIPHVPRLERSMPHRGVIIDVPVNVRQGIVNVLHALKAIALAASAQVPPYTARETSKDVA